jgi:hypothetical protein
VPPRRKVAVLAGVAAFYLAATVVARRLGYRVGGNVVVRCRRGHLFTTLWVPGATFKALKLGWWRLQWCPVGKHVSLVSPVRDSDLTAEQKREAEQHHDVRVP